MLNEGPPPTPSASTLEPQASLSTHHEESPPAPVPPLHAIATFSVVAICTLAFSLTLVGLSALFITGNNPGTRDFVSYWAAGHQLARHANPYDMEVVLRLERSVGLDHVTRVVLMRNPPPVLPLVLPLGLLGLRSGALLWSSLLLVCLLISVRILWTMHGRPRGLHILLASTFGPALACILVGQTALFALLGLVLFLRLHRTQPFLAGTALWLCAIKPHLFLPFAVALLAWIITTSCYRILFGLAAALAFTTTLTYLLDPLAWGQYHQMMTSWGIEREAIPCISDVLRTAISPNSLWLQLLPAALGCAWALLYLRRHRTHWNWMDQGSLLMLVSVLVAPYAWFTDESVLIPAIVSAIYRTSSRPLLAALALASAAVEIEILRLAPMHSRLYLWTAPAWLAWYLWTTTRPSTATSLTSLVPAVTEPR